jgi:hypothetical protein
LLLAILIYEAEVIPSGEGLIRTMGYADFNCTDGDLCDVAHHAADTGGEFAAAASLDLKWYPQVYHIFHHPAHLSILMCVIPG